MVNDNLTVASTGSNQDAIRADLSTNGRFVSSIAISDVTHHPEPAWRPKRERCPRQCRAALVIPLDGASITSRGL